MKLLLSFTAFLLILISCNKKVEDVQTDPQFKIDSLDLYFGPEAGKTDSFTVFTDLQWSISISPSTATWLQLNVTGGTGQRKIVATTLENNPSDSSRTATITVTPLGSTSAKPIVIKATQYGKTFVPSLKIDRTSITLDGRWNSIDSLTVESNVSWIIPDVVGFNFKPNTGTGITKVYVTPSIGNHSRGGALTKTANIIPLGTTAVSSAQLSVTQTELLLIKDWNTTFGEFVGDKFNCIAKCSDGGYIIVGNKYRGCFIVKLSSTGTTEWTKVLNTADFLQEGKVSIQTSDGGYMIAGIIIQNPATVKYTWIAKLDAQGNMQWEKTFASPSENIITDMIPTSDGGYVLTGNVRPERLARIIKVDGSGNMQWDKTYSQKGFTTANAVKATSDGGYIFVGSKGNSALVAKIDGNGTVLWDRTVDSTSNQSVPTLELTDITETKDGNFLLGGYFSANFSQFDPTTLLVKINPQGNFFWIRDLEIRPSSYNIINSIISSSDGGFVIASIGQSTQGDPDGRIAKISDEGKYAWSHRFGGTATDYFTAVIEGPGNSYIAVGIAQSWNLDLSNRNAGDAWLLKVHEQY